MPDPMADRGSLPFAPVLIQTGRARRTRVCTEEFRASEAVEIMRALKSHEGTLF